MGALEASKIGKKKDPFEVSTPTVEWRGERYVRVG